MKYYVIGGCGYLGYAISSCLAENAGDEVICIDPDYYSSNIKNEKQNNYIYSEFREQSITQFVEELNGNLPEGTYVWCCDIDIEDFYITAAGHNYRQKMSRIYKKIKESGNNVVRVADARFQEMDNEY